MDSLEEKRALYPRVSEIIGKQTDREMRSIPIENLVNACIRGTKVDTYCTAYLNNCFLPEMEEEYKPYVESFIEWADQNIERTIFTKIRLYDDELKFSGEPDALVILKRSACPALIDLKATAKSSKSWGVQLAAYKHLCKVNGYEVEDMYNVHVKKTKVATYDENRKIVTPPKTKVVEIPYPDTKPYWAIFVHALGCYDYFDRKEDK